MHNSKHPGVTLRENLDELGLSASEFARRINVPANRITEILNCRRSITGDTALRLGHYFGVRPEIWLRMQKHYELTFVRKKIGSTIAQLPTLKDDEELRKLVYVSTD